MARVYVTSISDLFSSSPELAASFTKAVFRAEVMQLLPASAVETRRLELNDVLLRDMFECVAEAGIDRLEAVKLMTATDEDSPQAISDAVRVLWQALDASPYPEGEWIGVRERLGDEQLARLLAISPSSLRRYASGQRPTPDAIAWRLHTLARIVAALVGSYNDYGVRRWFDRPRAQLGGYNPAELFAAAKNKDDDDLLSVVELAEALVGPALAA